ncbi:MAG: ABC transporter permease [Candidatus Jordarchaeaceae archaeon]
MPIISKEKRRVYARKIAGFWLDFSHNRVGLIGLAIIIFYVFIAIAGPYLTPYPVENLPRVANSYAMPSWVTLFPQYKNLPPTITIPLNSLKAASQYSEINLTDLSNGIISYQLGSDDVLENRTFQFKVEFNYTYDKPKSFTIYFIWNATFENLRYRIEINITNPRGETYVLLGRAFIAAMERVAVPSSYWNMNYGSWLTSSGAVELTRVMNFEKFYNELYPIYFNQSLLSIGYSEYYNSTRDVILNLYNRTVGDTAGFDKYFEEFWEGNETWTGWAVYGYGSRIRTQHRNTLYTFWQRAGNPGNFTEYFNQYWYGNETWTGFWNTVVQKIFEREKDEFESYAAQIADLKAKIDADQKARSMSPVDEIFVGPGEYVIDVNVIVEPIAPGAKLNIKVNPSSRFIIWGSVHGILGADHQGRDVLTQVLAGARISLIVGILAAISATVLEIFFGVASGYLGGFVDEAIMRTVDVFLCLPVLPILLALSAYFKPNVYFIVLLIAIFGWQGGARVIRSRGLTLRELPFVESAKASGASDIYIIFRHLIPNVFPIVAASMVLAVPGAIITEAALSFLGFGDPLAPTWGKMLHEAQEVGAFSSLAWWYILPPGFGITFLCVAFVFVGHALDEIVNPRLRRRR